ncbi:MAG: PQQ-binding-like beta-propeller repeat protein, partial [bacterium]
MRVNRIPTFCRTSSRLWGAYSKPATAKKFWMGLGVAAALGSLNAPVGLSDEWGHWRGPIGNGVSNDAKPPIEFGAGKNLRWKVDIPGSGSSSPVVWGEQVFVTTAVPTGKKNEWDFRVLCYD